MSFNRLNSTFIYFHYSCTFHVYIYNTFHVSTLRGKMLIAYEVVRSYTVVLQSQDHCLFVKIKFLYSEDTLRILTFLIYLTFPLHFEFTITVWISIYVTHNIFNCMLS